MEAEAKQNKTKQKYFSAYSEISESLPDISAIQLIVLLCMRNSFSFQDYTPNKKVVVFFRVAFHFYLSEVSYHALPLKTRVYVGNG